MRYVCSVCGYIYDEAQNPPWDSLPDSWRCPLCGAPRSLFHPEGTKSPDPVPAPLPADHPADLKSLNAAEVSTLCSNLARGCEKQYKHAEAEAFTKLAEWFRCQITTPEAPDFESLLAKVNSDLSAGYPACEAAANECKDRGALRALVWSGKVTRILSSLLSRYQTEGEDMLNGTGVYVCTVCGFIYVGNEPPEKCPVCKVPSRKFEKIGG